ncbi:unnamed protein product [Euphydryas editha]|uniref:Uncharacterized protein n=1 Tax=Euphydryas editha TaxID=104508 RepID=A0AAU9VB26_EUPED|nr:unnamed protein product [Euphydryas editha]
MHTTRLNT